MLLSASGGVVMAVANDLIVLFLGLEILSIAVYVLAAMHLRRVRVAGGGHEVLRARRLLLGLLPLRHRPGLRRHRHAPTWSASARFLADEPCSPTTACCSPASPCCSSASASRSPPCRSTPGRPTCTRARPRPVVAFMASGVKAAGFAGAAPGVRRRPSRPTATDWQPIVYALAVLTLLVGAVLAVVQTNVKRMLAYSSISHAGFILVGVAGRQRRGHRRRRSSTWRPTRSWSRHLRRRHRRGPPGRRPPRPRDYRGLSRREPAPGPRLHGLPARPGRRAVHPGFLAKFYVIGAAVDAGSYWLGHHRHAHRGHLRVPVPAHRPGHVRRRR